MTLEAASTGHVKHAIARQATCTFEGVDVNAPRVFTGCGGARRLAETWSDDYLEAHGASWWGNAKLRGDNVTVAQIVRARRAAVPHALDDDLALCALPPPLLATLSATELPSTLFCGDMRERLARVRVHLTNGSRVDAGLRIQPHDTLHVQLAGVSSFTFVHPHHATFATRQLVIDAAYPVRHVDFAHVPHLYTTEIGEADVLYVPHHWWRERVHAPGRNIDVTLAFSRRGDTPLSLTDARHLNLTRMASMRVLPHSVLCDSTCKTPFDFRAINDATC